MPRGRPKGPETHKFTARINADNWHILSTAYPNFGDLNRVINRLIAQHAAAISRRAGLPLPGASPLEGREGADGPGDRLPDPDLPE